jgi:hypothetical protein
MNLELNLARVLSLFTPLWALLLLSLWLNWADWVAQPWYLALVIGPPALLIALVALFARRRWRLELTPTELVHHTLGRTERFDFARMGPVTVKPAPLPELVAPATLWFVWPTDAARGIESAAGQLIGRRILAVFGDHSAAETAHIIETWRKAHGVSSPAP